MPGMLHTREAGRVLIVDPGSDKPVAEYGMSYCCHCGGQFPTPRFEATEEAKKTRVGRGWCQNCAGYICGAGCATCVPVEQYLENLEAGRDPEFKPVIVPTSFL